MGTDITLYVEYKKDGVWRPADDWNYTPEQILADEDYELYPLTSNISFFSDGAGTFRNYEVFAVLANVRNNPRWSMGDAMDYISDGRGVPDDSCPEIKAAMREPEERTTWVLLSEILDFDFTKIRHKKAFCDVADFWVWNQWARHNQRDPQMYCQDTSQQKISEAQALKIIASLNMKHQDIYEYLQNNYRQAVAIEWDMPYFKECAPLWEVTIPRIIRLAQPQDVRLVMSFW